MVIELQEPFASKWSLGYLRINNDGRRIVDLYLNDKIRTTISYARYLMGVKLGCEVPDHLEVDHRDNDKTNDDINNLQLLTSEENKLKQEYHYVMFEQVRYGYYCAWCTNSFILTEAEVNNRLAQNVELAFCSRSCSASHHYHVSGRNKNTKVIDIDKIKALRSQGLSVYKIADITGYSRNTIMKYW